MQAAQAHGAASLEPERLSGSRLLFTARNGPVNSLSQPMRQALLRAVLEAAPRADIRALVFTCSGSTFHAGADLAELDTGLREPGLLEFVQACAQAPQVVVAALHGTVYGGGLVVALACDWRVAEAGTRFAMPEVGLGLLPTFGGTQLLPRLLGVEAALRLIVDGEVWSADQALRHGLVDEVVPPGARVPRALAASLGRPKRPVWAMQRHRDGGAAARAQAFSGRLRAASQPQAPLAPRRCLEVMQLGLDEPLHEALRLEHAAFLELLEGPQSRRLRRRFFGERALRRAVFDRQAAAERLCRAQADPERLREEARALLATGMPGGAAAVDALLVECLDLPRHAPSPLEDLFAREDGH